MILPDETDGLIARIAMADQAAFQKLFEQTSSQLFAVCLRILKDQTEAEACIEDLFTAIWNDADAFRGPDLTPMARLVTEARGVAIARKRIRYSVPEAMQTRDLVPAVLDVSNAPPNIHSIADSLAVLQPARSLLLRRVCFDGDGYTDLAAASEVDAATVRTSLQKALAVVSQNVFPDKKNSIAAAEYALFLLPQDEAEAFETRLATDDELAADLAVWRARVSDFILSETQDTAPPAQVLRRLTAALFTGKRATFWDQLWPYAVGGIIAAVVLWLAVRAGVLLPG